MEYNININQKAIVKFNERNDLKLDIVDGAIMSFLKRYIGTKISLKYHKVFDNEIYFYITYSFIINQNPLINITCKDAISRRVSKLETLNLIKRKIDKEGGNKTYIHTTDLFDSLYAEIKEEDFENDLTNGGRIPYPLKNGYPIHSRTDTLSTLESDNHNTNNHKTNHNTNCIAEQGNFSQNETLVLTKDNLAKEWEGHFKVKPSEEQEDKFLHFWNTMGKAKKDKYKNCWQTYFHTYYKLQEKYPNAELNPLKIAEQEALEREKRLGEMRSEKEEVEKYFKKNEYDANLTNVFQEKVKETRGENTLKQIEDVKVVEFNKEKRCIVLSGSEASRNMIYSFYTAWINKLKLGVSFNKIYCLTLKELKKYKQKELDLSEITTII